MDERVIMICPNCRSKYADLGPECADLNHIRMLWERCFGTLPFGGDEIDRLRAELAEARHLLRQQVPLTTLTALRVEMEQLRAELAAAISERDIARNSHNAIRRAHRASPIPAPEPPHNFLNRGVQCIRSWMFA